MLQLMEMGANLEVFSLALQNGPLEEKDLLRRQTPITAERKDWEFKSDELAFHYLE